MRSWAQWNSTWRNVHSLLRQPSEHLTTAQYSSDSHASPGKAYPNSMLSTCSSLALGSNRGLPDSMCQASTPRLQTSADMSTIAVAVKSDTTAAITCRASRAQLSAHGSDAGFRWLLHTAAT